MNSWQLNQGTFIYKNPQLPNYCQDKLTPHLDVSSRRLTISVGVPEWEDSKVEHQPTDVGGLNSVSKWNPAVYHTIDLPTFPRPPHPGIVNGQQNQQNLNPIATQQNRNSMIHSIQSFKCALKRPTELHRMGTFGLESDGPEDGTMANA